MKTIAAYSLGTLAYMTATEGKDPNTFVTKQPEASSGIIWNEDATLCLMMDNFFIDKKVKDGQDWKKHWEIISKTPARKQRHLDDGATPRCEDTKVFWSEYCFNTLTNSYADDEAKWLAEDPNVEKALFRVSVHADMNDIFCIIPEGDYCLKEEPGTYKMQSIGSGRKFEKFRFLPFDGVNPDNFFDFDDNEILVYGSDSTGWEKLNVQGNNGKLIKRINVGNDLNKVQKKRLKPVNFGEQLNECDPNPCANGSCVVEDSGFSCNCYAGWEGELCDELVMMPCTKDFNDNELLTEQEAQTIALSYNKKIGGAGYSFTGDWSVKGLYYYGSGAEANMAYFGTGGTIADQMTDVSTPAMQALYPSMTRFPLKCKACASDQIMIEGDCFLRDAALRPCTKDFNDNELLTEQEAQTIAQSYKKQLGGKGNLFAGDYTVHGLYYYASGPAENMSFFGTGGTVADQMTDFSVAEIQALYPGITRFPLKCKACASGQIMIEGDCFEN